MVKRSYSLEPEDPERFREDFDRFYTSFADLYDLLVKALPIWKRWLSHALPHIRGQRVLEVSFGTGYLLTQYADEFESYGVDYNWRMIELAERNLARLNLYAALQQGNVENLPYADAYFDTVINTMSLTGYPDGSQALSEMKRVLRPGGRLILIDINYPNDGNWAGTILTRFWKTSGDLIRDIGTLLENQGFVYQNLEIGGFGSVHLYICEKI